MMNEVYKKFCNLCPRKCYSKGIEPYCQAKGLVINRVALHMYEEPIISGTKGSGTIFFGGCNLGCDFCQNYQISHNNQGEIVDAYYLVDCMRKLVDMGAHNINLVTPNHYVDEIIKALKIYKPPIPVVYNTSSYDEVGVIESLRGLVDIFLADFKYMDSSIANRYSHAQDLPQVTMSALVKMREVVGKDIIKCNNNKDPLTFGLMTKGLIVRHLVLPSYTKDSIDILHWIHHNMPDTLVSLMFQYTPFGNVEGTPINRRLTTFEYKQVLKVMEELGLNGYCQDRSSAVASYTPDFS